MSSLKFLSRNLVDNADISIITGIEDAQFPLTNLLKTRTTKVFRSTTNTVEILIDLKVTQSIDYFAIVGNNLTGLGYTDLELRGSATTDFTSSTVVNISSSVKHNFGFSEIAPISARFWKLSITNTGSYCELSNFFLGKKSEFVENSFSISSFNYRNLDKSRVLQNKYGQKFVDKLNTVTRITGTMQHANNSEFEQLDNIINDHGKHTPLWILLDSDSIMASDGAFRFSGYFYIINTPAWSASGFGLFNASLSLEQVV